MMGGNQEPDKRHLENNKNGHPSTLKLSFTKKANEST